jgi:uncharacterized metal-binding protein
MAKTEAKKDEGCGERGCLCASGDLLFLACAGGSNVGQISNRVAVELAKEGRGRLFCLAGIGAHLDTMILAAKERRLVAIDGCPVQCAKKILDHAGLEAALSVVVTEAGIDKTHSLDVDAADCAKAAEKIKEALKV